MSLRGINQSDLSRLSGVSMTSISRFLNDSSELRAESLLKILSCLGADVNFVVKREISRALGQEHEQCVGEDIRVLLDQAPPIARKTIADTLIASFKFEKSVDTKQRISRLKKYRDSIKTVRRHSC